MFEKGKVNHPEDGYIYHSGNVVAFGLLPKEVRALAGTLAAPGAQATPIQGRFFASKKCWLMHFPNVPVGNNYCLELFTLHPTRSDKAVFKVANLSVQPRLTSGSIIYPNGSSLDQCPSGFFAYGESSDASVSQAVMIPDNGADPDNEVFADYIANDPDTSSWFAEFPELPEGTYKLVVTDSSGNTSVDNIDVDSAFC